MQIKAPLFDFYEEVRIESTDADKVQLTGQLGVVLGRTETDDQSSWHYAILLQSGEHRQTWSFPESELKSTGRKFERDDFYTGTVVKVVVDELGRGRLADANVNTKSDETNKGDANLC